MRPRELMSHLIRLKIEMQREDGASHVNEARPLSGLDVLDVWCGGGLLSEVRAFVHGVIVHLGNGNRLLQG